MFGVFDTNVGKTFTALPGTCDIWGLFVLDPFIFFSIPDHGGKKV